MIGMPLTIGKPDAAIGKANAKADDLNFEITKDFRNLVKSDYIGKLFVEGSYGYSGPGAQQFDDFKSGARPEISVYYRVHDADALNKKGFDQTGTANDIARDIQKYFEQKGIKVTVSFSSWEKYDRTLDPVAHGFTYPVDQATRDSLPSFPPISVGIHFDVKRQ